MTATSIQKAGSRSDHRIPKLRTRGRANRERLLAEAQRLIEEKSGKPLKFSDVFQSAGVSRGSAYRIYNGIDDLMQDLSSTWINDFVSYIRSANMDVDVESWAELSDLIVVRGAEYWVRTADTLRVLPRVRSNVPESYRLAVHDLTAAVADIFDKVFVIPEIEDWHSVLSMYTALCDTIFSDAVRREGFVSDKRLAEAQKIGTTYLSFYLPTWLPVRARED
ncbi:MAG: TetR/AcrR family transcriptional regulator [Gammaproteobacteria bacterium]|nr:TetR/AcrR family transcriptional regulator [Gammaproteobacteria bacterium]